MRRLPPSFSGAFNSKVIARSFSISIRPTASRRAATGNASCTRSCAHAAHWSCCAASTRCRHAGASRRSHTPKRWASRSFRSRSRTATSIRCSRLGKRSIWSATARSGYERLGLGLKAAGIDPSTSFDWDGKRPPYPGMMAFEEEDAARLLRSRRGDPGDARAAPTSAPLRRTAAADGLGTFRQRQVVAGARGHASAAAARSRAMARADRVSSAHGSAARAFDRARRGAVAPRPAAR